MQIRSSLPAQAGSTIAGAVMAGGRSSRFGSPKMLAEFGGTTLLGQALETLSQSVDEVAVVATFATRLPRLEVTVLHDRAEAAGPLAGVQRALEWGKERAASHVLCIACDTPLLGVPLLRALVALAKASPGRAVAAENRSGDAEPLCTLYPVEALGTIARRIERGEHALRALLAELGPRILPAAEIERYGNPDHLFFNVNTASDFDIARRIAWDKHL